MFVDNSSICHWMVFKKVQKMQAFYFYNWLYLCILYQWIFLYWRLKDTTKNKYHKKKVCGLVVWPDPDWSMISNWNQERWLLIIRFSRRSLAFFLLSLLVLHLSVSLSFFLCFSLSLSFFLLLLFQFMIDFFPHCKTKKVEKTKKGNST